MNKFSWSHTEHQFFCVHPFVREIDLHDCDVASACMFFSSNVECRVSKDVKYDFTHTICNNLSVPNVVTRVINTTAVS